MANSIKRLSNIFFIGLIAFFLVATAQTAHAQAPTTTESPSEACSTTAWMCPNITDLDAGKPGSHRLKLEASNLPTVNSSNGQPIDIHVVCGISTDEGDLFSSGNKAIDQRLCIGDGTLDKMKARPYQYGMSVIKGKRTFQSADGNAEVIVKPVTNNIESHSCFFVWELPPEVVDEDGGARNEESGDSASLAYATFRFEGAPAACVSYRADPFGRTFNNQTLKPVPGATVSLFDFDSKSLYTLPGVTNPVITREDGLFNFNIEPGTTYLQSNLINAPTNVHQNASLAYSNIYTYGDPIVETLQKAEQRDIPVSNGNAPVLKLMDYSNLQFGNETRIEGKASWPLTFVEVMQGQTTLNSANSDEFGVFTFMLRNSSIDPTKKVTIKLTEVDLTQGQIPQEGAATVEEEIDPIPRYLEGYAYDRNGNPIPFAKVLIKLKISDQVYYETEADGQGFFSVGPRFLPILPYYLEFSAPGATGGSSVGRVVTVPEHASENADYHRQQDIDIMAGTKAGRAIDPDAVLTNTSEIGRNGGNVNDGNSPLNRRDPSDLGQDGEGTPESLANRRQAGMVMLFLLIVLFFVVAFGLAVYLKRKHKVARSDDMGDMYRREGGDEPEAKA